LRAGRPLAARDPARRPDRHRARSPAAHPRPVRQPDRRRAGGLGPRADRVRGRGRRYHPGGRPGRRAPPVLPAGTVVPAPSGGGRRPVPQRRHRGADRRTAGRGDPDAQPGRPGAPPRGAAYPHRRRRLVRASGGGRRGPLAAGAFDEHLRYWRAQLADAPGTPGFAVPDHQRGDGASGYTHAFRLGAAARDGLAAIGRPAGATLFMVLLAAFDVLLYAYSGSTDLVVTFPESG